MNIVFLDRATLPGRPFRFDFPHQYAEYPLSNPQAAVQRAKEAAWIADGNVFFRANTETENGGARRHGL